MRYSSRTKIYIFLFSLFLGNSLSLFSQVKGEDPGAKEVQAPKLIRAPLERFLGDSVLRFAAGVFLPTHFIDPPYGDISKTNLSTGFNLTIIAYDFHLNNYFRVGGALGWDYATSPNKNAFSLISLTATATYDIRFWQGRIGIPIRLGIGVSFPSYQRAIRTDFLLKPGVSILYNINEKFAVAVNYDYSFTTQNVKPDDQDRFGSFHAVSVGLEYAI